jgi:hypothetical protein
LQGSSFVEDAEGENRACSLQVVSDGSTSCVYAGSAGRATKKRCALSLHLASEVGGVWSPIAAQMAYCRSEQDGIELRTRRTPKTNTPARKDRPRKKRCALSWHGASEADGFRSPIAAQLAHSGTEQDAIKLRPAERPKQHSSGQKKSRESKRPQRTAKTANNAKIATER